MAQSNKAQGSQQNDFQSIQNSRASFDSPGHCGDSGNHVSGAEVDVDEKIETQRDALPGGANNHPVAGGDAGVRLCGGLPVVGGEDALGQAEQKGQASLRDRQPVSVFDSAQKPVQVEAGSYPVLNLPVENKGLAPACTGQPVQAKSACPPLIAWRQADGGIWLPRYFTAVPHLKYEYRAVDADFKPVLEMKTGWQIQWATACPKCGKRFRPVAGFITILHLERMRELPENEQQDIIADIIRQKFETGSINSGHPRCFS